MIFHAIMAGIAGIAGTIVATSLSRATATRKDIHTRMFQAITILFLTLISVVAILILGKMQ